MATVTGKMFPVGLRQVIAYELDANGYPAASGSTSYNGLQMAGAKAFEVVIPDARQITHTGDDRVLQKDALPAQDGSTATVRTGRMDYDVYALFSNTEVETVGEAKAVGYATSQQGNEPQVGLLCYQQAIDDSGTRSWRSFLFPKAKVMPKPGGMTETPPEHTWQVVPQVVTKNLWGDSFTSGCSGYTSAEMREFMTEGRPHVASFLASGASGSCIFASGYTPAKSTAKVKVFKNGTDVTSSVTVSTTQVTFTGATQNDVFVIFYELA